MFPSFSVKIGNHFSRTVEQNTLISHSESSSMSGHLKFHFRSIYIPPRLPRNDFLLNITNSLFHGPTLAPATSLPKLLYTRVNMTEIIIIKVAARSRAPQ